MASSAARISARRAALSAIKKERGCVDCGRRDGELHFDHRPDEVKLFTVSQGVDRSWVCLLAEIAKCDVRCNACHPRRHIYNGDIWRNITEKAAQTHCVHGHELSGKNVYIHPKRGTRHCVQCDRDRQRAKVDLTRKVPWTPRAGLHTDLGEN